MQSRPRSDSREDGQVNLERLLRLVFVPENGGEYAARHQLYSTIVNEQLAGSGHWIIDAPTVQSDFFKLVQLRV
jgi:hypothetical protein